METTLRDIYLIMDQDNDVRAWATEPDPMLLAGNERFVRYTPVEKDILPD